LPVLLPALLSVLLLACGDPGEQRASATGERLAGEGAGVVDHAVREVPPDRALHSLRESREHDGVAYRAVRDTAALRAGVLVGRISTAKDVVGDSAIVPTHDLDVCHPFTETHLPAQDRGVGNAVVWLAGVATGPEVDAPRRATLTLDRCQLSPRVQRMATGGTLQVSSRDAMTSRLRFVDVDDDQSIRTQVDLNDAGQLVPTSAVSDQPGLVAVRDDRHPWVRAYIAVAAHPFVAVTTADGAFRFGAVPPGRYTLVVWQEQLGVRTRAVRVTTGVETRVHVEY
jgi:hypothetical protein